MIRSYEINENEVIGIEFVEKILVCGIISVKYWFILFFWDLEILGGGGGVRKYRCKFLIIWIIYIKENESIKIIV